ncbi:MAG: glycoside hydrolase family 95 protein [Niabella sp.]
MMKRYLVFFLLFFLTNAYLYAQDYKLWYNKPAVEWTEALPIGNGRMGAMIFGDPLKDHIQFNEETIWTDGPRNHDRKDAVSYLPQIRQLLFEGKQKEAEAIAQEHFMGLRREAGDNKTWLDKVLNKKIPEGNPADLKFHDGDWNEMEVPANQGWEAIGFDGMDGAVWLRTYFNLPKGWEKKSLLLDLGVIRDEDFTYVNGKLVGHCNNHKERLYSIPAGVVTPGKNVISILVINYKDKGGIIGKADSTKPIALMVKDTKYKPLLLKGKWRYYVLDDNLPTGRGYQGSYQPFGDLSLIFNMEGDVKNYRRELDLGNALVTTTFMANEVHYRREYLASSPDQAIVINLSASKAGKISFEAELNSAHRSYKVRRADSQTLTMDLTVRGGVLSAEARLHIVASGGVIGLVDGKLRVSKADNATIYLVGASSFVNYNDVTASPSERTIAALNKVKNKSYTDIRAAHISDYRKYYDRLFIRLGTEKDQVLDLPTDVRLKNFATSHDPEFAALYLQYGRYLLISSSRPGTQPANLQGIWNDKIAPPWGSKYTCNINLQMNYWPANPLNLSEMEMPLIEMINELRKKGANTARSYYGARGWVLHHNTDLWRATAPINKSNHGIWVTGGAWLCHHLWEHYLFTRDRSFLEKTAYPAMIESAMFFIDFLVKDPQKGWLISTPSNSPENGGLVAGPTMDHQIIRSLFRSCLEAGTLLGKNDLVLDTIRQKLANLAPDQIGKHGQLQEWLEDKDNINYKHRHVSHLWGVYPGNLISWNIDSTVMKAARQSLIYRGDEATGWSLAWKINFWARFRDSEHAMLLVNMLLRPSENRGGSYSNLFDAHPPFQIDGNFGGAAGIAELLLQSQNGILEVFPALPKKFSDGKIKGLCARGGFEVDMEWSKGVLNILTVSSKAGGVCKIKYGGKDAEIIVPARGSVVLNSDLSVRK